MATWRVGLVQALTEECTVQVEAATAEEAAQLAIGFANNGDPIVQWRFLETVGSVDVVTIDQITDG